MDTIESEPLDAATSQRAPHALYVTGEDNLRCTVFNTTAGVIVTVRGRFEDLAGNVVPFVEVFTPNSSRTASTLTIRLGNGWLLGATVFVSSGSPLTGNTHAILSLIRGEGSAALELMTLAAGPITAQQRIGYPGSSIANSLDGNGSIRLVAGSTPAAGAEFSETVPTGVRWELLSFKVTLTTSAAVSNRRVYLTIDDGATRWYAASANLVQAASQGWDYIYAPAEASNQDTTRGVIMVPIGAGLKLLSGYRLRSNSAPFDAADQYSALEYLVREWLEVA